MRGWGENSERCWWLSTPSFLARKGTDSFIFAILLAAYRIGLNTETRYSRSLYLAGSRANTYQHRAQRQTSSAKRRHFAKLDANRRVRRREHFCIEPSKLGRALRIADGSVEQPGGQGNLRDCSQRRKGIECSVRVTRSKQVGEELQKSQRQSSF
jgi:hypothetical protein